MLADITKHFEKNAEFAKGYGNNRQVQETERRDVWYVEAFSGAAALLMGGTLTFTALFI